MPRADRIKAGDRQLSARNINKVIEQANRLESAQGGSGVGVLNDETGIQIQNMRRRQRPDGDTPYSSSGPLRRTLKKRSDSTRHKTEWELYNSSFVSAKARQIVDTSEAYVPEYYALPFLPQQSSVDSSIGLVGGNLNWATMDADEFGTSGPRSLERRSSSSGERFQIYDFDSSAPAPSSSVRLDVCVRANFGSGTHYIAWIKGGMENDHSWHYDAATNTITEGSVWHGDNSATALSFNVSFPFDSTPDSTTSITYYIEVDWSNNHKLPTIRWINSVDNAARIVDDDEIEIHPVLEFDSNGVCIERLQSDLHVPLVFIPEPPSRDAVLWWDYAADQYKYTTTDPQAYMVLQYKADDTVDFDWPRFNAETP